MIIIRECALCSAKGEFLVLCSDGKYRCEECEWEDDGLREFEDEMTYEMDIFRKTHKKFYNELAYEDVERSVSNGKQIIKIQRKPESD